MSKKRQTRAAINCKHLFLSIDRQPRNIQKEKETNKN